MRLYPSPVALALAALAAPSAAQGPGTTTDLSTPEHADMREALGQDRPRLDDWLERIRLSGFLAARAFDTERGGSRPDGAIGIQAATLFVDADVSEAASAFFELRFDYFAEAGQNQVDLGEAYIRLHDVLALTADTALDLKVGRFDLAFGEWYLLEDPNRNRMIGFPAVIPYRWDEGVQALADFGPWGFAASLTDGTYSRNSESGVAPAATLRLHARPTDTLYLSASTHYVHDADATAICFGGSVLTPVAGGQAGTSPSPTIRSLLGCLDLKWQATPSLHVQASFGAGRIDDPVDAFDRSFLWWMLEPSWTFAPAWHLTTRWSAVGTFDDREGYQFEGRPYEAASASYGFDLSSRQRFAAGLQHDLAANLLVRVEVGADLVQTIEGSLFPDATRWFTGAELVLSF